MLLVLACTLLGKPALAFAWPWEMGGPWPVSSTHPMQPLDHPSIDGVLTDGFDPHGGFRFVAYSDRASMADGEWQEILSLVAGIRRDDPRLLFILDGGDIIHDGTHTDQFRLLREILSPVREMPYLVAAGNHEVANNRPGPARRHTARFLSSLSPFMSEQRMYYEKRIGPLRLLMLDSNVWAYGMPESGRIPADRISGSMDSHEAGTDPGLEQFRWLAARLDEPAPEIRTTIVVMHHPLVQSSAKHRGQSSDLWNRRFEGKGLADLLADGGVELVLSGHTHTFEHFRLTREDGRGFDLLNISGRPRDAFLWFGSGDREARDLRGREMEWLADRGWRNLDRWEIRQEDAMLGGGSSCYGVFSMDPDVALDWEIRYLSGENEGFGKRE